MIFYECTDLWNDYYSDLKNQLLREIFKNNNIKFTNKIITLDTFLISHYDTYKEIMKNI